MTGYRYGLGLSRLFSNRYSQAILSTLLGDLVLSNAAIAEDVAQGTVVGTVVGLRTGSTWAITSTAGSRFAKSGNTIVTGATALDYATATDFGDGTRGYEITLRETNAGYENSPKTTTVRILVTAASATLTNTLGSSSLRGNQVQGFIAQADTIDARITALENA